MLNLVLFVGMTRFWILFVVNKIGRRRKPVADAGTHAPKHLAPRLAVDVGESTDSAAAAWTALDDRQLARLLRESAP